MRVVCLCALRCVQLPHCAAASHVLLPHTHTHKIALIMANLSAGHANGLHLRTSFVGALIKSCIHNRNPAFVPTHKTPPNGHRRSNEIRMEPCCFFLCRSCKHERTIVISITAKMKSLKNICTIRRARTQNKDSVCLRLCVLLWLWSYHRLVVGRDSACHMHTAHKTRVHNKYRCVV